MHKNIFRKIVKIVDILIRIWYDKDRCVSDNSLECKMDGGDRYDWDNPGAAGSFHTRSGKTIGSFKTKNIWAYPPWRFSRISLRRTDAHIGCRLARLGASASAVHSARTVTPAASLSKGAYSKDEVKFLKFNRTYASRDYDMWDAYSKSCHGV